MSATLSSDDLVPSRTGTLWPKDENIASTSPPSLH